MKYFQSKINNATQRKHICVGKGNIIKKIALTSSSIFVAPLATLLVSNSVSAENTSFQVNVKESLSVSITSPAAPANGNTDTFLRNRYTLNVSSNNINGFTASMYAVGNTNLTNTAQNDQSIPTLASSSTRGSFPTNFWGYSLGTTDSLNNQTYNETEIGNASSVYYPLVSTSATPITVLTSESGGTGSQDIYFGAKAGTSKAAGTYSGIVVISVVSGVVDDTDNPITPTNPAGPNAESDNEVAKYTPAPTGGSSSGVTTYTYRRANPVAGTNTVTTQISDGDNRDSYSGYTPPQGVKENTTSSVVSESSLAAGLATTAIVATATGMFFFVVAKRREDDDDDEA